MLLPSKQWVHTWHLGSLPGVIMSVLVKVGDTVKASDTVISLEAMKMENAIHAGRDGKVTSIDVNVGDSVLEGHTLVTIE